MPTPPSYTAPVSTPALYMDLPTATAIWQTALRWPLPCFYSVHPLALNRASDAVFLLFQLIP